MPRRRLSGAAVAFLLAVLIAPSGGAADERIVPDQDLSDLSREEQVAYLILNDQLSERRQTYLRLSEEASASQMPDWMPMFCIVIGSSTPTDSSVDPSEALLDALRRAQSMQEPEFDLVPASACDLFVRSLPRERSHAVAVIFTDVTPLERVEQAPEIGSEGGQYSGGWYPHFVLTEGFCTGICAGGAYYEAHEEGTSTSLTRVRNGWD